MRGLAAAASEVLNRRLSRTSRRPLAVAFSGGGDSLALLLMAHEWAREVGRELLVLHVDHGLRPESAEWTKRCRAVAERLGRPFGVLKWEGPRPDSGLPAAAREARHALLADAARKSGAGVILFGHTGDDLLEGRAMREAGSSTPDPREWSPSPAWPEGRRVFLLRPLLALRRGDLRRWLTDRREAWIEDPANEDLRFARSRARAEVTGAADPVAVSPQAPLNLASEVEEDLGALTVTTEAAQAARTEEVERLLVLAAVCAGGGARLPSRRTGVGAFLRDGAPITLAGARLETQHGLIRITRESGEARRGGLAVLELRVGTSVWDGRYELATRTSGLSVRRLEGCAALLAPREQRRLRELPPSVRRSLPVIGDGKALSCPLLADDSDVTVTSLVGERLRAASGLVEREDA